VIRKASIDLACRFYSKISCFDIEGPDQMSYVEGFFENIFEDGIKYEERIPFVMSSVTWGAPHPRHGGEA